MPVAAGPDGQPMTSPYKLSQSDFVRASNQSMPGWETETGTQNSRWATARLDEGFEKLDRNQSLAVIPSSLPKAGLHS